MMDKNKKEFITWMVIGFVAGAAVTSVLLISIILWQLGIRWI